MFRGPQPEIDGQVPVNPRLRIKGLIVEVAVRFGANSGAAFAHRVPVFLSRSSRSLCFSSQ
jgi:hypothetical protein